MNSTSTTPFGPVFARQTPHHATKKHQKNMWHPLVSELPLLMTTCEWPPVKPPVAGTTRVCAFHDPKALHNTTLPLGRPIANEKSGVFAAVGTRNSETCSKEFSQLVLLTASFFAVQEVGGVGVARSTSSQRTTVTVSVKVSDLDAVEEKPTKKSVRPCGCDLANLQCLMDWTWPPP